MKEKELIKNVLATRFISQEGLRQQVMNRVRTQPAEGGFRMKRKLAIVLSLVLVLSVSLGGYVFAEQAQYNRAESFLGGFGIDANEMTRSDVKAVYRDITSDSFQRNDTLELLKQRAVSLGIEGVPEDARDIYDLLSRYSSLIVTAHVTSQQVRSIQPGTSFGEIINILGPTKDVGSGFYVVQYVVDGTKLLLISFADENDICPLSGDELLQTVQDIDTEGDSVLTFNAQVINRSGNSVLVSCPTYAQFDIASVWLTDSTVLEFEDGHPATIEDLQDQNVIVTYTGEIRESYPVQITATKIIIKSQ